MGKLFLGDLAGVVSNSVFDRGGEVYVLFGEERGIRAEAEHVREDEDLPVAVHSAADTDEGNINSFCNFTCSFWFNHFTKDTEAAYAFELLCPVNQTHSSGLAVAIATIATERVNGLREQADVPHNGDTGVNEVFNFREKGLAADLNLYRLNPGLLHEAAGRQQQGIATQVSIAKGNICNDEGLGLSTVDCSGVMDDGIQRDVNSVFVAECGITHGVSHEDEVHRIVDEAGHQSVVGGDGDNGALTLERLDGFHRGFFTACTGLISHRFIYLATDWHGFYMLKEIIFRQDIQDQQDKLA